MSIHIILLYVVMVITLAYYRACDLYTKKKECIIIITLILTFFCGLRSWWLGDLIKYYTLFRKCKAKSLLSLFKEKKMNIGIRVFFHLMGSLGLPYEACLFVIAAFSMITLGILVFKYSPAPYWSYLMYISMGFYLFTYSGLKQTIAMAFVTLALMELFNDNPWRFCLWMLIAFVFHGPSIVVIFAYPITHRHRSTFDIPIIVIAAILTYAYRNRIVSVLSEAYYENEKAFVASRTIGGRSLMMIFIILLAMYMRPVWKFDSIYKKVFDIMVIAVFVQYFSIYNNVFTRLADYFFQYSVLFIPLILESSEHQQKVSSDPDQPIYWHNKQLYAILGITITLFSLWYYHTLIHGSSAFLADYKFIWQINPYMLYGK